MAPKHHLRGSASASAFRGAAVRGRRGRGRGSCGPRSSRGRGGHGGSAVTPPVAGVDEDVAGHDFVLHIRGPVRRRIALPLSIAVVLSELIPSCLWLRA